LINCDRVMAEPSRGGLGAPARTTRSVLDGIRKRSDHRTVL